MWGKSPHAGDERWEKKITKKVKNSRPAGGGKGLWGVDHKKKKKTTAYKLGVVEKKKKKP